MDDLENKLGAILNNPELMQQIMSLAQNLGAKDAAPKQEAPKQAQPAANFPELDLSMIQKLSGFAKQSGIDKNQQSLLKALRPYLSSRRISKLEQAMRAAKMASFATTILG